MSFEAIVYKVLISSPSDVIEERRFIPEIIHSWNEFNSEVFGVVLLPVMWETHSTPEMGERPQAIINKQIVEGSDILIGTFWTRIGTKTGVSESGTVEEIEEFIKSGKPTLIYFSLRPVIPDSIDLEQYERLKEFKQKCEQEGLIDNYSTIEDLRNKLVRHLTSKIISLGHTVKERKHETDYIESNEILKRNLINFCRRYFAEWSVERDSHPKSIEEGKNIIYRFGRGLLDFRVSMDGKVASEIISNIDEIIKHSKQMQRYRLFIDGGKSFKEFWETGDKIFKEVEDILEKLKEVP